MKIVFAKNNRYVIRLSRGEDIISSLLSFARTKKVRGAWIEGLGACEDPALAYYDLQKKKYLSKKWKGVFEIVSATGNIAMKNDRPAVHLHVVLGERNYRAIAGHLVSAKAGGTMEISVATGMKLKRTRDGNTGLYLLT